jgi:signal transduction histidine kinase
MKNLFDNADKLLWSSAISRLRTSLDKLFRMFHELEKDLTGAERLLPISRDLEYIRTKAEELSSAGAFAPPAMDISMVLAVGVLHDMYKIFMSISCSTYELGEELQRSRRQPDPLQKFLDFTEEAQYIVDIFHTLSAISGRRGVTEEAPFNLVQTIDRKIKLAEADIRGQRIEVMVRQEIKETTFTGDEQFFGDVIFALLQNAIEALTFMREQKKKIGIRITEIPGYVKISVTDNGPGISKEIAPFITKPYVTDKPDHAGLGLTMAELTVIEAFSGHLGYRSGKGQTSFTITLKKHGDQTDMG